MREHRCDLLESIAIGIICKGVPPTLRALVLSVQKIQPVPALGLAVGEQTVFESHEGIHPAMQQIRDLWAAEAIAICDPASRQELILREDSEWSLQFVCHRSPHSSGFQGRQAAAAIFRPRFFALRFRAASFCLARQSSHEEYGLPKWFTPRVTGFFRH